MFVIEQVFIEVPLNIAVLADWNSERLAYCTMAVVPKHDNTKGLAPVNINFELDEGLRAESCATVQAGGVPDSQRTQTDDDGDGEIYTNRRASDINGGHLR
jgi:hypothetical protein